MKKTVPLSPLENPLIIQRVFFFSTRQFHPCKKKPYKAFSLTKPSECK